MNKKQFQSDDRNRNKTKTSCNALIAADLGRLPKKHGLNGLEIKDKNCKIEIGTDLAQIEQFPLPRKNFYLVYLDSKINGLTVASEKFGSRL